MISNTAGMKKFLALLCAIALVALSFSCKKSESGNLPSASMIVPVITVEKAIVTFSLPDGVVGVTPAWFTNETGEFKEEGCGNHFQKTFSKEGAYKLRMYLINHNGMSLDYAEKDFEVRGLVGFDYNSEDNIWGTLEKSGGILFRHFYAHGSNWEQMADPECSTDFVSYSIFYPQATDEQWQAQFMLQPESPLSWPSSQKWDFSCIVTLDKDCPVTIKIHDKDNEDNYYKSNRDTIEANKPFCFEFTARQFKYDVTNLVITFDFGGCQANTEVNIRNIVFQEHK